MKYLITRPDDLDAECTWMPGMDEYDGTIQEMVPDPNPSFSDFLVIVGQEEGWLFSPKWCTPITDLDEGRKDDSGKIRYDLIPPFPLQELAKVYTMGAAKYDSWNWAKGMAWSRLIAALGRHWSRWLQGEELDEEGQHHLDSIAWIAFTLRQYVESGLGEDDRHLFPNRNKEEV